MKAYSKDLRLRVLAAVDRGMPRSAVVETFGVSLPTTKRWLEKRRETGDVEPEPILGPPAPKREALLAALPSQAEVDPDLTLAEHRELFEETHGTEVSTASVSRDFARLGLPLKSDEGEWACWRGGVGQLDPRLLVFVDECGTHTSMTRLRARAPKGERAYGRVPRNRGRNMTLLASMTHRGMGPCLVMVGSTTKAVFEA